MFRDCGIKDHDFSAGYAEPLGLICRHCLILGLLFLQGSTLLFSSIKAAVECTLLVLCVSSFADQHSSLVVRLASDQHSKIEP